MQRQRGPYRGTEQRRRAILDAALSCFSELGFVDTAMDDIRKRSGASHGSIYHHFGSKEQLAAAVYLQGIRDYQSGLTDELSNSASARDAIRAVIRYHLVWTRDHVDHARFLSRMRHAQFMGAAESALAEENRSFVAKIADVFRHHVREGALRMLPGDLYMAILLGPAQEIARHWLLAGKPIDVEHTIDELSEAAWRALRRDSSETGAHEQGGAP